MVVANKPLMSNVMRLDLLVRAASSDDAQNLAALATQAYLHTYATEGISRAISGHVMETFSPAKISALIADPVATVWVAELHAHLIGFAVVMMAAPCADKPRSTAELTTLYVQEHFIGKGVGSALLAQATAFAAAQTGAPLWLTVNAANAPAIAFYARHGLRQIGVAWFQIGDARHENQVLIGAPASRPAAAQVSSNS